ncbi:MAG: hypothetical protein J6X57_04895 [Bacteroidales bacterium]|nr:hypothetical protein [Bacteroidales bacterium]
MKRALILLSALLLCLSANAGGREFLRRLHPGIEWGYTLTATTHRHFNYLDPSIGFRINEEGWMGPAKSNAFIHGSLSFDATNKLSISLLSGYEGIADGCRTVPVICRANYYLSGMDSDGFYLFTDLGVNLRRPNTMGNHCQIGSGYSLYLAPHTSVAMFMGARVIYDRPDIWDPIEEEYIPKHNIKRNDAWYCALNIGITLKF